MFQERDRQALFFEDPSLFLPPEKAERLKRSWAERFRTHALPLINEERFAALYCPDNGRPNRPVQTVLGVLFLKEMFDLTDRDALDDLEFNLMWHHALALRPEEAHLSQKTLHNFRAGLMKHDLARVAFEETTDRIIAGLGLNTSRQRLDSTHIMSNMARLTRLGLFCETIRVFMSALKREHPKMHGRIPNGLLGRYFDEAGPSTYEDASSEKARRRLPVCARDLFRLVDMFRGTAAAKIEEYALIQRLLAEQCEAVKRDAHPDEDDDDAGDTSAPVQLKECQEISGDSLQSPHDPDATYNAHKGKGYEVQVAETCHEDNGVQIITHVEVTRSCEGDARQALPVIEQLEARGVQPAELVADAGYGSAENALAAERLGTELISPVPGGPTKANTPADEMGRDARLSLADFKIDASGKMRTTCPAGHEATDEFGDGKDENRAVVYFGRETCENCALRGRCPVKPHPTESTICVLNIDLKAANRDRRRRAEATDSFAARYKIRAGIEATNSELKRRHGLGNLRVRKRPRVELAVYLKTAAANIKRMVAHLLGKVRSEALAAA
jgi:hypothetical protein